VANYKWAGAADSEEISPIDCCDAANLGCGVVGLVPSSACCRAAGSSPTAAFNHWLGRGYSLEDWVESSTMQYEPDPAA
jgi:hypothetical protein